VRYSLHTNTPLCEPSGALATNVGPSASTKAYIAHPAFLKGSGGSSIGIMDGIIHPVFKLDAIAISIASSHIDDIIQVIPAISINLHQVFQASP
jgi:hydrogenase/urease accessory protein HupE